MFPERPLTHTATRHAHDRALYMFADCALDVVIQMFAEYQLTGAVPRHAHARAFVSVVDVM